jgi:hypothetical protein
MDDVLGRGRLEPPTFAVDQPERCANSPLGGPPGQARRTSRRLNVGCQLRAVG